jgi:putative transposase
MSRPLRLNVEGGWYHVFGRGLERRSIFREEADRRHFLELLCEMHERYRILIHAYAQMDNHYHTIVETPDANLSECMQWLHTSYSTWFNAKHSRVGPLFQGRYGAKTLEGSAWGYDLSFYVHLNPLRVRGLGLDKRGRVEESRGYRTPPKEVLDERLKKLRTYRWSSYRAYAGYSAAPPWLTVETLLNRAHKDDDEQRAQYRSDAKQRLTYGADPDKLERLRDAVAIGSAAFAKSIREGAATLSLAGVAGKRELRRRIDVAEIHKAVILVTGVAPECSRRGDLSRPLFLWAARQYSGLTLSAMGEHFDSMTFSAVSAAVKRFELAAVKERNAKAYKRKLCSILNVEP